MRRYSIRSSPNKLKESIEDDSFLDLSRVRRVQLVQESTDEQIADAIEDMMYWVRSLENPEEWYRSDWI